jgi:hypothetical protein
MTVELGIVVLFLIAETIYSLKSTYPHGYRNHGDIRG